MNAPAPVPRIGIVGAGRSRQGLGPYLARAFERAGCRVAAVSGRERAGAERAATQLAAELGHPVAAAEDAAALARTVDALVVAAPVGAHLDGLDAALAAAVPCLCEKPLVAFGDLAAGRARIAQFRERGLLLCENTQWPFVLPALFALHPELRGRPVRSVAMGLGPGWPGFAMVEDSLSHVLSVVQALAPLDRDAEADAISASDCAPDATANVVRFRLGGREGRIDVALHLLHCPQPPRPAWLEVDGARIDRRLGADYAMQFVAEDGRAVNAEDPLHRLVYGFAGDLKANHRERTAALADEIDLRLRLYAAVLGRLSRSR